MRLVLAAILLEAFLNLATPVNAARREVRDTSSLKLFEPIAEETEHVHFVVPNDLFASATGYSSYGSGHFKDSSYKNKKKDKGSKGYKGNEYGDHGKNQHSGKHEKGGKHSKGSSDKKKYSKGQSLSEKGNKGQKHGSKGHTKKGNKDKGYKNIWHSEEFGRQKKFYEDFDSKTYHSKYDDYDSHFKLNDGKKYKGKNYKGAKKHDAHGHKDFHKKGKYHDLKKSNEGTFGHKGKYDKHSQHGKKEAHKSKYGDGHGKGHGSYGSHSENLPVTKHASSSSEHQIVHHLPESEPNGHGKPYWYNGYDHQPYHESAHREEERQIQSETRPYEKSEKKIPEKRAGHIAHYEEPKLPIKNSEPINSNEDGDVSHSHVEESAFYFIPHPTHAQNNRANFIPNQEELVTEASDMMDTTMVSNEPQHYENQVKPKYFSRSSQPKRNVVHYTHDKDSNPPTSVYYEDLNTQGEISKDVPDENNNEQGEGESVYVYVGENDKSNVNPGPKSDTSEDYPEQRYNLVPNTETEVQYDYDSPSDEGLVMPGNFHRHPKEVLKYNKESFVPIPVVMAMKEDEDTAKTQQISVVTDGLLQPSATGKGYSEEKGHTKEHHESKGGKAAKGGKKEKGFKGSHKGDHSKVGDSGFADKGGKVSSGKDHKDSYKGHSEKGKKGKKGHSKGSKGHHSKGFKDKGFKNEKHKFEYAVKKKYYDDNDLSKYHSKHNDFDAYFQKHKDKGLKGDKFFKDFLKDFHYDDGFFKENSYHDTHKGKKKHHSHHGSKGHKGAYSDKGGHKKSSHDGHNYGY